MKARALKYVAASILFAAVGAAQAEYRCNAPHDMIDARACAKAAEGADALRLFVERTRMLWNLYYWDYAQRNATVTAAAPAAKRDTRVAAASTPR